MHSRNAQRVGGRSWTAGQSVVSDCDQLIILEKISKTGATRHQIFIAKMHQIRFLLTRVRSLERAKSSYSCI